VKFLNGNPRLGAGIIPKVKAKAFATIDATFRISLGIGAINIEAPSPQTGKTIQTESGRGRQ
jgi:hypothetical protein